MLFAEPPRTRNDVNFVLFGFPVRIHPFFWLVSLLLGFGGVPTDNMRWALVFLVTWTAALLISILIHELGHALVMRRLGFSPRITLHGFGGLASYDSGGTYGVNLPDTAGQIWISAAGPGAGFILAGTIVVVLLLTGNEVIFGFGGSLGVWILISQLASLISPLALLILTYFVQSVLWVSIVWGLVNLLPVYPLDGGQISREVLLRISPGTGIRTSLVISMWTAGIVCFVTLVQHFHAQQGAGGSSFPFVPIMFGYLAYNSYTTLQGYSDRRSW